MSNLHYKIVLERVLFHDLTVFKYSFPPWIVLRMFVTPGSKPLPMKTPCVRW